MLLVLVVLFVVLPLAELAVIIQVAQGIGIGETILLLIAISAFGGWLVKREGLNALRRVQTRLQQHELPARDVVDGGLILLAGALLLAPGFLTDVLAVLLLLPPTRALFRGVLVGVLAKRARIATVGGRAYQGYRDFYRGPGDGGPGGPGPGGTPPRGVIDTTGADDR